MAGEEQAPFGTLGDLVELLVPIATDLVEAIHEEGPQRVWGILHRVPVDLPETAHLPGGAMSVLAMVCAGMVNPDASMGQLLGWAEAMIPDHPPTSPLRVIHGSQESA